MTGVTQNKVLVSSKYNQSASYLLPLLAKHVDIDCMHQLVNTYMYLYPPIEEENKYLMLLYSVADLPEDDIFFAYEAILRDNPLFVYDIPVGDRQVLYVFKMPEEFHSDYSKFIKGKYSQFSNEAKVQIIQFTEAQYRNRWLTEDIVGVLWKKKERKAKLEYLLGMSIPEEIELSSICSVEKETLVL